MKSEEFDVAVVGAGIVGASCAWECARSGLRVAVVDAGLPGSGTTATNAGQVIVEDGSEAEFALTRYSVRLWNELAPELPAAAEFVRGGTIWVAATEAEFQSVERRQQQYVRRGVRAETWDAERLRREEPGLSDRLVGGLWMPDDATVTATPVAVALTERVRSAGGSVRAGDAAIGLEPSGVRLRGGELVRARRIVNAAGVASPTLSPGVPVRPRKGHLAVTDPHPGVIRHQMLEMGYVRRAQDVGTDSISFNIQPRPGGVIRIGSSRQLGLTDPAVDPAVVRAMVDRAAEYLPQLSNFTVVRSYTGFRPASGDGLPLIGPWPRQEGVFLATGHEGLGITMSLATGRLVADQILGRRSEVPIEPYLPRRVDSPAPRNGGTGSSA